jgi:hypothetical protein
MAIDERIVHPIVFIDSLGLSPQSFRERKFVPLVAPVSVDQSLDILVQPPILQALSSDFYPRNTVNAAFQVMPLLVKVSNDSSKDLASC